MTSILLGHDIDNRPFTFALDKFPGPFPIYCRDTDLGVSVISSVISDAVAKGLRVAVFTAAERFEDYRSLSTSNNDVAVARHPWEVPLVLEGIATISSSPDSRPILLIVDSWDSFHDIDVNAAVIGLSRSALVHVIVVESVSRNIPEDVRATSSSALFVGLQDKQTSMDYEKELVDARELRDYTSLLVTWLGGRNNIKPLNIG